MDDLRELVRESGPWLIRYNIMDRAYQYIVSSDQRFLSESEDIFSDDPSDAVPLPSGQVLQLIPYLNNLLEQDPSGSVYFEPVKPSEAKLNFRELWLTSQRR